MIFLYHFRKTGFVTLNFTPDNLGRLEPLLRARFAISEPEGSPAPRKRV